MMRQSLLRLAGLGLAALLTAAGCAGHKPSAASGEEPSPANPPAIPREFRGVWLATVANIDFPSEPGLPMEAQQEELDALLDLAAEMNLNAIIFQVRTTGDALYDSKVEPWSAYLTGTEGEDPGWDPLAYAVEGAHRRGMELHAWINPLRVGHPSYTGEKAADHISNTRPDLVRSYGPLLWMDPGDPDTLTYTMRVVRDIVSRYDIDGLHIDDYFYPYPRREDGKTIPFPDDETYGAYQAKGGRLGRDDWRRQNVDRMIEAMYRTIKQTKRDVLFGISPFGIWQPGHPEHIKGMNQYGTIYADAKKWFERGWCDYFTPQLYWEIANPDQGFISLLQWWSNQNAQGRHLWPGVFTSRTEDGSSRAFAADEIPYQVKWTRIILPEDDPGHVHFSAKALQQNRAGLRDTLSNGVYAKPALVPATTWLGRSRLRRPVVDVARTGEGLRLTADPVTLRDAQWWTVQVLQDDAWSYRIVPGSQFVVDLPMDDDAAAPEAIWVTSYDANAIAGPADRVAVPSN